PEQAERRPSVLEDGLDLQERAGRRRRELDDVPLRLEPPRLPELRARRLRRAFRGVAPHARVAGDAAHGDERAALREIQARRARPRLDARADLAPAARMEAPAHELERSH